MTGVEDIATKVKFIYELSIGQMVDYDRYSDYTWSLTILTKVLFAYFSHLTNNNLIQRSSTNWRNWRINSSRTSVKYFNVYPIWLCNDYQSDTGMINVSLALTIYSSISTLLVRILRINSTKNKWTAFEHLSQRSCLKISPFSNFFIFIYNEKDFAVQMNSSYYFLPLLPSRSKNIRT